VLLVCRAVGTWPGEMPDRLTDDSPRAQEISRPGSDKDAGHIDATIHCRTAVRDLHPVELAIPAPLPGEVLVRVHASGVNPLDTSLLRDGWASLVNAEHNRKDNAEAG
jgi:hypothetical protein